MKLRRIIFLYVSTLFLFCILSCQSTKVTEEPETPEEVEQTEPVVIEEPEEAEPEEEIEEAEIIIEEDEEVEYVEEVDLEEEEYLRSINNLNNEELVTKQQFSDDKAAIIKIIDELISELNSGNIEQGNPQTVRNQSTGSSFYAGHGNPG